MVENINTTPTDTIELPTIEVPAEEPIQADPNYYGAGSMDPQDAERRTFLATYGSEKYTKKSYDDLYRSLLNGGDKQERETAAANQDMDKKIKADRYIAQTLGNRIAPISANEAASIKSAYKQMSTQTDPISVFEKNYANQVINQIYDEALENPTSPIADVNTETPAVAKAILSHGEEALAKNEYVMTKHADAAKFVSQQSWIGPWTVDFAKQLIPLYGPIKMMGNVPGAGFTVGGNILPAQNIEEQGKLLWRMPFKQFTETVDKIYDKLMADNPQMAREYFKTLIGTSRQDMFARNFWAGVDVATLPTLVKFRKGGPFPKGEPEFIPPSKPSPSSGPSPKGKPGAGTTIDATYTVKTDPTAPAPTPAAEAAQTVQNVVQKVSEMKKPTAAKISEAVGNVPKAGERKAAQDLIDELSNKPSQAEIKMIEGQQSFMIADIQKLDGDAGSLGREVANRIQEQYGNVRISVQQTLANFMRIDRMPGLAAENTMANIRQATEHLYPELSNHVLDIRGPRLNEQINNRFVDMFLGSTKAELFSNRKEAVEFANNVGIVKPEIIRNPQGGGYLIRLAKPMNEIQDVARDGLLETKGSQQRTYNELRAWTNRFGLGREMSQSLDQLAMSKRATVGPSVLTDLADEILEPIQKLSREGNVLSNSKKMKTSKLWDLQRILNVLKDAPDLKTNQPGRWLETVGELDDFYLASLKRSPTILETEAYFAYKALMELDRTLRDMLVTSHMLRTGSEYHMTWLDNNDPAIAFFKASQWFVGKRREKVPNKRVPILLSIGKNGQEHSIWADDLYQRSWGGAIQKEIREGRLKFVEPYDPEQLPLDSFTQKFKGTQFAGIITRNLDTKPLTYQQVNRRGGGHVEVDMPFYGKQPKVNVTRIRSKAVANYNGDNTAFAFRNRAEGEKFMAKMDEFRELMRTGNFLAAKKFAPELGINYKELRSWFYNKKAPNGDIIPPRFSMDLPFGVVAKDTRWIDTPTGRDYLNTRFGSILTDNTRSGSLARTQSDVAFTQERNAYEINQITDVGTQANPVYQSSPARNIDPILTMNRALNNIVKSSFLDDYKSGSVEAWIQRGLSMKTPQGKEVSIFIPTKSELRGSPFWWFHQPGNHLYVKEAPQAMVNAMETERWQIQQMLGQPSAVGKAVHSMLQRTLDYGYEKQGSRALVLLPDQDLVKSLNPIAFLRSIGFHPHLGMYNPITYLTQIQSFGVVYAVAGPKFVIPATQAFQLSRMGLVNPSEAILDKLDDTAVKMYMPGYSYKPGEWKEAQQAMTRLGWATVGREYSDINDISPRTIQTRWGQFLDGGTYFFRNGEKHSRMLAWHTAYLEWRSKHPNAYFSPRHIDEVLNRADDMLGNMTRASNGRLQQGIASVPTQFYTYPQRMAELLLGKGRLTPMERARVLMVTFALYGLPATATLTGVPFADTLRQKAVENDYIAGENWLAEVVVNGLPSFLVAMASGKGDWTKGWKLNVGPRFGPSGYGILTDLFNTDTPFWKMAGGASFSTIGNTLEFSNPMRTAIMSMLRGDGKFQLTFNDVMQAAREISAVNSSLRWWTAVTTGRWVTKNGNVIAKDVSPVQATFMTALGLSPTAATDARIYQNITRQNKQGLAQAEKQFRYYANAALNALENDPVMSQIHFKNAMSFLEHTNYPIDKKAELLARVLQDRKTMPSQAAWEAMMRNQKAGSETELIDKMQRYLKANPD